MQQSAAASNLSSAACGMPVYFGRYERNSDCCHEGVVTYASTRWGGHSRFSLEMLRTIFFQAEVIAFKECVKRSIDRDYNDKNVYINSVGRALRLVSADTTILQE